MRPFIYLGMLLVSLPVCADDLLSLYKRAVLASPELSGSEFALEVARAQEDQAFGQLLPKVSIRGNYSLNRFHSEETRNQRGQVIRPVQDDQFEGNVASINARQPLFDAKAYLLMKSQKAQTSQKEEELQAAHQKLIVDLVDSYMEALEASDKREIIATELDSTVKQLARVESLQSRQLALITDLYTIQAKTETLRTELIDSDNEANIALEKLRELTGDKVTSVQSVRLNFNQTPPQNNVATWIDDAGKLNPDLKALNYAVDSAKRSITGYQAGHLPRVELQVSGTYNDTAFTSSGNSSPAFDIGTLGVEATIPLYEGGITSATVKEAQGRKGLNEARREQKLRELEQKTRAAYLDMTSSPARSLATDRQLEASEKSRDAMIEGYELGVVTIVDLLNAEKQLSESRKIQREARYRYIKAYSMLYYQAGRLLADEVIKLNSWLVAGTTPEKSDLAKKNPTKSAQ
ncbi:TolC family outer membrane protein [Crenothrix sp.]|uniref:TolC family outer membrane protein n=1 Tax=Crenothrix sp. TaxID=3100433 RepID=UPI00374CB040